MKPMTIHNDLREILFMTVLIIASVPIGYMFRMNLFNASIIWPTLAISFAFLFLRGRPYAVFVFLSILVGYLISHTFFFNLSIGMIVSASLLLTLSGFIAASFGAWMAQICNVMLSLKVKDILLSISVGLAMALVAAFLGNASLLSLGMVEWTQLTDSFLVWFLGDFYGLIIFGLPLVMSLQIDKKPFFEDFNWKEGMYYAAFILFTFFFFRGDIPYISFVFHKYVFIPFAIITAFFFPLRTIYMFSLIFLVLISITQPFFLDPNIFMYMSEINFLLVIVTAIVITLKLVMIEVETAKSMQLQRQRRLNTLVGALQELFSFSSNDSLLDDEAEQEAAKVFRLIARLIGSIDYGSCAVVGKDTVRFIDTIGFDKDLLNAQQIPASHWIKDLKTPQRYIATRETFESIKTAKIQKAFTNSLLERIKESVFMSVRLSDALTCELSFDIDMDSSASFGEETMEYFEGLNILLNTFFEANKASLDPGQQTSSMIVALLRAIDLFDADTRKHSERVGAIARRLAKDYGLSDHAANTLFWAGIVHDIGKIGLDINMINKPTALSIQEYETMKTHPVRGYTLLRQSSTLENIAEYVHHHHEHYDGTGYPDQLKHDENLKESSILAIAEAIAAMVEKRPYSAPMDKDEIISVLNDESGHQFDPEIVECAIASLQNGLLKQAETFNVRP